MFRLVLLVLAIGSVMSDTHPVWPMPNSVGSSVGSLVLSSDFSFVLSSGTSAILQAAFTRTDALIFSHGQEEHSVSGVPEILVQVDHINDGPPPANVDESYTMDFTTSQITLSSKTIYGALRGLTTFSQLVSYDFDNDQYLIKNCPSTISDAPRYAHRGLMVDTCRHFIPIPQLLDILTMMSYVKLNVFHWHIVDSQAFTFQSKAYPKLWNGAYTSYERYNQRDMRKVVNHATQLGIRVILELDGPGHALSWGVGYPKMLPSYLNKTKYCADNYSNRVNNVPMDPTSNTTYDVLQGVINELFSSSNPILFDEMIHLGGDEVVTECWSESPQIADFMKAHGYTTYNQLYQYYVDSVDGFAWNLNKTAIHWQDVFDNLGDNVSKKDIIQVWRDFSELQSVVGNGYQAILSNSGAWYLSEQPYVDWQTVYSNEPTTGIPSSQQSLILGGEACIWGENMDGGNLQRLAWPRGFALAERLWTSLSNLNSLDLKSQVEPRLSWFRCLTVHWGADAETLEGVSPPSPGNCLNNTLSSYL